MKITLISNVYPPYARGGAEVIVQRMAEEYRRQGHEVSLITTRPWSDGRSFKATVTKESGITLYRYAPPNIFFYLHDHKFPIGIRAIWHLLDLLNLVSAMQVKSLVKRIQPDLVITHNLMGMSYFIPSVLRSLNVPHTHILHDIQLAVRSGLMRKGEENSVWNNGFLGKLYQAYTKRLFGSPQKVLSPSKFLQQFYQEKGFFPKSHFEVKRNPLVKAFFADSSKKEQKQEEVVFGYVGQLEKHKGIEILQKVFTQWGEKKARLELVGSGALKDQVKTWAEHDTRVVFKGRVANRDLPAWYKEIDCLLLPTLTYENSPTVIYEAFASGTPVIASNIGGTAEMITNADLGEIVEPGDGADLLKKLQFVQKKLERGDYDSKTIQASVKMLGVEEYCKAILLN